MDQKIALGPSSDGMKEALKLSREAALETGHATIGLDDLLIGILRSGSGAGARLIGSLAGDLRKIEESVRQTPNMRSSEDQVEVDGSAPITPGSILLTSSAESAVKRAYEEAFSRKKSEVGTEHLLLSILQDEDNVVSRALATSGITYQSVRAAIDRQ